MKMIFSSLALLAISIAANTIYQKHNHSGLIAKLSSCRSTIYADWESPPPSLDEEKKVHHILSQRFSFLAKGSQSLAFVSQDGKYVLKVFRAHKWQRKNLLSYFPFPLNPYYRDYKNRQQKHQILMHNCMGALLHIKEDTGVIFTHFNPTPLPLSPITIMDKRAKPWLLDLSQTCFLLQKKAELFYPHLQTLMDNADLEGAKHALTSAMNLLNHCLKAGTFDHNSILRKHFGFVDNEAIEFDIGKFKFDPEKQHTDRREICMFTKSLRNWIKRQHPELLSHFDTTLTALSM